VGRRYAKNPGAVFRLKYHVVWCPKYRRPVLVKPVDARWKEWLRLKAEPLELTIHEMQVMPDHVHLFVEGTPMICVAEIVNGLKGFTSHELRAQFPFLKSRLPTLGSRNYDAGSVGRVSEAVVRKYLESQMGK
jgi:putative transposase